MDAGWQWWDNVAINCKKCTLLVRDVDNGVGYACVGAENIWTISVSLFCCEPKIPLKK